MKTQRLTTLAILIAIYVVLSVMTPIKISNFKFTFEAFPILVAGFLLGPADGFIVGFAGSLIYQLFFSGYGITPTTPLWILPHALSGLFVGYMSKRKENRFDFEDTVIISAISAFIVTALNTLALYVDSKMYGYYSFSLVFSGVIVKIIIGIILAIIYCSIMPQLLKFLNNKMNN